MKKELSTVLDMSRWLAAFFVTISHLRHIVFVDYGDILHKNIFIKVLYVITGFGHEAVMVFFVLSGFLVGGTTLKKWKTVNVADYFVHRFSRIYAVLIPALLTGYVLDYLGSAYFNGSGMYTDATQYVGSLKFSILNDLTFSIFINNLFMMGVPLGSNAPLWSLMYEWWYYCIFAACFGLALRKNIYTKLICLLALVALTAYCSLGLWVWMIIWWLGVAVFFYCEYGLPKLPVWISLPLFIAALVISRTNTHNVSASGAPSISATFINDLGVGFGFSLLLISLRDCSARFLLSFKELHKSLASFSYSLYLSQVPLVLFTVTMLHDVFGVPFQTQPSAQSVLYYCLLLIDVYAFGYLFYVCTEKHTARIRKFILQLLGIKPYQAGAVFYGHFAVKANITAT